MNALTEAVATETSLIEAALDALLTAATAARRERAIGGERGPISAADLAFKVIDRLKTWTPAQRAAGDLLERPVSQALRQAIRTLGERLFEIGGLELMLDVCYRVAERDEANQHFRIGVLDHRWDGIGQTPTNAGWLA